MKKQYYYAVKGLYSTPADITAQEFERVIGKYGKLTPDNLVDESRDVNSVLHCEFNWDDTSAAEAHRREQAKRLIGSLRVIVIDETVKAKINVNIKNDSVVRAFVNVRTTPKGQRSYHSIEDAVVNDTAYMDLFEQSKREMETFIEKYNIIVELAGVKNEMHKILNKNQDGDIIS
jgi:hypothetical protein